VEQEGPPLTTRFFLVDFIFNKRKKAYQSHRLHPRLLGNFIVQSVGRTTFFIGLIMGLIDLRINVDPLLAFIGAVFFSMLLHCRARCAILQAGIMIM